jgi:ribosomal protein S13
MEENK